MKFVEFDTAYQAAKDLLRRFEGDPSEGYGLDGEIHHLPPSTCHRIDRSEEEA